MRRRLFIQTAPAAAAFALVGCGGGGGGSDANLQAGAVRTSNVAGVSYPFGSRLENYRAGILPSASPAEMDSTIARCYDAWKAALVVPVPTVEGGLAISFGHSPTYLTVSEGMGYGMLIAVVMAGYDPGARALFDGLLTTVRARPAGGILKHRGEFGRWLMDWRLAVDGRSSDANDEGWNAMDGDLDIALALLMADRQWGSNTGPWNYKQEGINTINAMKVWNFKEDGTTKGMATSNVSRISDYMISHFRAFKKATNDPLWDRAIDRSYELVRRMQTVYSPGVGLMPDFIVATDTAEPRPSPGNMGDWVDTEMHYYANSQRNPWRWGTDYVLSGDERWGGICDTLTNIFKRDNGGDPARTATGFRLDGSPIARPYPAWSPIGMIGPQLCGAMVNGSHQDYLNALWKWNSENFTTRYYDSELQLIPMLVASGNWWAA